MLNMSISRTNNSPSAEILEKLPHEAGAILLDHVVERPSSQSVICGKYLHPEDPAFTGHFPGNPVYPGVLLLEALAQAACLIGPALSGAKYMLVGMDGVRFNSSGRPRDYVKLHSTQLWNRNLLQKFTGVACVNGHMLATGTFLITRIRDS